MSRDIVFNFEDGRLYLNLHKDFYLPEAIRAAAYKFTDSCYTTMRNLDEYEVIVIFESKPSSQNDLHFIAREFLNEVLDQQIRLDLESRYGDLRKQIVKQAFAPVADLNIEIKDND